MNIILDRTTAETGSFSSAYPFRLFKEQDETDGAKHAPDGAPGAASSGL
jgi:hypothetical protein